MSDPSRDARPYVHFCADLARTICRRIAAGEALGQICAEPDMPAAPTVLRWARRRSAFRRSLALAREAAGWAQGANGGANRGPSWREPSAEPLAAEVFARLCAGEPLNRICADPRMPGQSTLYRWRRDWAAFGEAMALARRIQAEALCEQGWALAQDATPETAYLTHVRLTHLRWMAGVFAPRFAGRLKAQVPEELAAGEAGKAEKTQTAFYLRRFEKVTGPDGKATLQEIFPPGMGGGKP